VLGPISPRILETNSFLIVRKRMDKQVESGLQ